ncbi:MAG: exosortase/archaeosortase family protein [Candidatus Eisenbacteria bacterium]
MTVGPGAKNVVRLALIAAIVVAYVPVLFELGRDWLRDPNYHHGILIPLISGYLIWKHKKALNTLSARPAWFGLAGLLISAALLLLGSAASEVFTQRVSLVLLLASLAIYLFGWRHLRLVGFPIAFLLLAIPLPYVIYYGLTAPMQAFAARCALAGLHLVGIPAVNQGNIIHLPEASLEVVEACSGIRSLYAFLAVGALLASSARMSAGWRVALFLTTIPVAIAGNALRVWGSGVQTWLFGPKATQGTLHEIFGLLVFAISLAVFLLIKKLAGYLCCSDGRSRSLLSQSPGPSRPSSG